MKRFHHREYNEEQIRLIKRERHSAWHWLRRLPIIGLLRVAAPIHRLITGHPIRRYSEVLPNVWVGGQHYRYGIKRMEQMGLSGIVNLRTSPDDAAMGRITDRYLWIPTDDHTPPTLADIQSAVAFIDTELESGCKVYVHCRAGVGRGPTMVACYLVSKGDPPHVAWDKIRKVRPFIYPTTSQLVQVESYYNTVNAANNDEPSL